ncbi:TadE-like protein [Microbacterium sp. AG1240]|uniref:TadE family type IV pilus minor pilin n=1 Tax=Microbacterium sp. AG1240 TaxID=2183992 RepID=UPI000EB1F186|nr:TadE family type IV pilus minor pilin [Microbacterium sp. AG1240]RKT33431.1 TadE-like protein [Microbacterium sp. AG1240]
MSAGLAAHRQRSLGERGSVTAEFAVVLPAIVLVVTLGVGALAAGARQVRLQHAAADAARLVARGDDPGRAHAIVGSVGGTADIQHHGDLVCVVASAPLALPLPDLTATSCALAGGL